MKKTLVIHPFLFAILPVLFLFDLNKDLFSLKVILLPITITTCFVLLSWFLLNFIFEDGKKVGLLISFFLVMFFSYGHFYGVLMRANFILWPGAKSTFFSAVAYFPTVWGIIFFLGVYFSIKTRRNLCNFTKILNVVAISLVAGSLINIGTYEFKELYSWQYSKKEKNLGVKPENLENTATLPNIYYLILDGYARADVLKEIYHYDNTEFLDYLTQKGFYVANKSSSNYAQTALSLASSLNLDYINNLFDSINPRSSNRTILTNIIGNNRACFFLKQYGYKLVVFSSGYSATEISNADIYLPAGWFLNEFQRGFIATSPIPAMLQFGGYDLHRQRILYTFDHLADTVELNAPIFVFAHIIAPHPPFVFGRNGEEINYKEALDIKDGSHLINKSGLNRDEYMDNYREQIIFVTKKIKATIEEILAKSTKPPIIILQADHGPGSWLDWRKPDNTNFKERLSILNAYYLPNKGHIQLYDEITPVNTFRIIFNHYFGTNYKLLKDESYFSTWKHPYKLINVTNKKTVANR